MRRLDRGAWIEAPADTSPGPEVKVGEELVTEAGTQAKPAHAPPGFWRVARDLVLFGALIAAVLGVVAVAFPPLAGAATPGAMVGAVTVLLRGRLRDGLLATAAQAVLCGVAFLLTQTPWQAGLLMAAVGVAMALAGRVGWRTVVMILAIFTASALFPEHVPGNSAAGSLAGAAGIALATLAGGALGALVLRLTLRHHHPRTPPPVAWADVLVNVVALGVTLGLGTAVVLAWDRGPAAAWLMITIVVLAQPSYEVTMRRSAERLGGVLVGSLVSAGLALVLTATWQSALVALAFFIPAWSYRISHPPVEQGHGYWVYALVSTPAMVLLAVPAGGESTLEAAGQRIVLTVAAVVSVVLLTQVARWLVVQATAGRDLSPPASR